MNQACNYLLNSYEQIFFMYYSIRAKEYFKLNETSVNSKDMKCFGAQKSELRGSQ